METPNTEMLRGRVDIFVLKAISDSDGYGYDILNYIHDKTEGHYEMKQSSVYSVLKRLEKQGYIYSFSGNESNGAKRRYYALTDAGKTLLEDQEKEWAYTRTLLDNLVSDKSFDLKSDTPPFHPSDLRPMTRRAPKDDFLDESDTTTVENSVEEQTNTETNEATVEENAPETVENMEIIEDSPLAIDLETGYDNLNDVVFDESEEKRQEAIATLYPESAPAESKEETPIDQKKPEEDKKYAFSLDPPVQQFGVKKESMSIDDKGYRDFYNGLFGGAVETKATETKKEDYSDIDCSHINDLKLRLEDEGIKLRSYDPSIPGKSTIKYLLTNKIVRDTSVLGYLTLVIFLLIVGLVKGFQVSLTAILVVGGIGLTVPAVCVLCALNNPTKRVKDGISLSRILLTGFIVYAVVFILNLIINLIVPNGNSLNTLPTYAPAIIALFIPLSTIIFALLYKSEKYHLSNR